ncbi:tRNA threonylcarbamoyladenosine dehydratase [Marinobacterium nitratireducens]|uniref:tRNA threonylcarbamoyladenosine dehydratase n=1 Tax=Marinobacterium nitratireducens TaxID=518897 RepID=A0A917ZN36_9GAMM|nr:tRNA cyclic N6-threonylcarbamoyladenosine(37) synthase TcdA [Marinobacterium nitratireducens]GGO87606.1 tRNA threonylcarbamoyladenosine dehydratase [Marinobacterium nitratireducens]
MSNDFDLRFGGSRRLYGQDAVELYRRSHVCVIGIGGVGSWVAEGLARTGIGRITLIDLDDVCVTNTNRQIHALSSTVGRSKALVMAERIEAINPECRVQPIEEFITRDNIPELISREYDYVVDAIDSLREKAALIAHCKRNKIPLITVGGAGGQTDPTRIAIADLSKTSQDPLAAKVRSFLRRHYGFSKSKKFGVDCVYSTEQLVYPQPDGSVCQQKTLSDGNTRLDCDGGFGASVCVTASFGFVAVSRLLQKMNEREARRLSSLQD